MSISQRFLIRSKILAEEAMMQHNNQNPKKGGIYCPRCKQTVVAVEGKCPICGRPFTDKRQSRNASLFKYLLVLLILAAVWAIILFLIFR